MDVYDPRSCFLFSILGDVPREALLTRLRAVAGCAPGASITSGGRRSACEGWRKRPRGPPAFSWGRDQGRWWESADFSRQTPQPDSPRTGRGWKNQVLGRPWWPPGGQPSANWRIAPTTRRGKGDFGFRGRCPSADGLLSESPWALSAYGPVAVPSERCGTCSESPASWGCVEVRS
jgi:hypothetical protein